MVRTYHNRTEDDILPACCTDNSLFVYTNWLRDLIQTREGKLTII